MHRNLGLESGAAGSSFDTAHRVPGSRTRNNPSSRNQSRNRFRFRKTGAHLTYRTHIPFERITNHLTVLGGDLVWFSFVHESSDQETNYDHTHVAFEWKKALDRSCPRIFDIKPTEEDEAIHPHIQLFTNNSHKQNIFEDYHTKAPIHLIQSETGPNPIATLIQQTRKARDLFEACEIWGIEPKSVSDVKLLRDDKPRPERFTHLYPNTCWLLDVGNFHNTYIWGKPGTGKTQFAVHLFQYPLTVRQRDDLRKFTPDEHDGIVFDDFDFKDWTREELTHLFDWETESSIHCRYNDALIPRFTRKVVTTNLPWEAVFHTDLEVGSIKRRFTPPMGKIFHVIGPTFTETTPIIQPPIDEDTESLLSQMIWEQQEETIDSLSQFSFLSQNDDN